MRISSTQYHATMNQALQNANSRLEHVMQQMASGQRYLLPSDNPVAGVRLSRMTREEAALSQYRENIAALKTRLTQNETTLGSAVKDMLDTRDLLVWASDGANTSDDVQAMSGSLAALRDSLFYTANSKDQEGRYLFSGTLTNQPTLADNGPGAVPRYQFSGNLAQQSVMVGQGITQAANVSLDEMALLLNRLDDAVNALGTPGVNVNAPATRALVAAALQGVDDALNSVNGKIAALGGAQNILDTLDGNHANVSVANRQSMMTLGQLDYGQAATQLSAYSIALQSTQKAYSKVSGLSLFELI
ncbi:MAG TPA: flagellar hook-associated protein FlgL [Acidovorax sp.]|jgi:flagellar hook-associated protein 3 FlgL|nr:flagellar hook-associated protein FlgL [Acidovorax sp.]